MTSSRRPATTLTAVGDAPPSLRGGTRALVWVFPRATEHALDLDFEVGEERVIGRDEGVAIRLSDPNASRRHASVRREGADTYLVDLGSRNGIRVNGRSTKAARLLPGDVVRIGDTVALVTDQIGPAIEIAPGLHAGPLLQAELAAVRRAASSDLPVILEGETGTGKEVVARAIHGWSGRSGAFVAVNCAALPEGLADGELFGYRRGAFTGAERASPGFFRSADGGTLLLDEIVDLPLVIQAKLLRVLEQREVQPLGESQVVPVNTRVIVAAQAPLEAAVARREFRADLLARLDCVTVRLPPLRERIADVPQLFQRLFAAENGGVGPALGADFVERLCLYDWPFNVREVVLLARRLRVLADPHQSLRARDLPRRILGGDVSDSAEATDRVGSRQPLGGAEPGSDDESPELRALLSALRACQGNVAQAAVAVGISRQRAYRVMHGHVDLDAVRRESQERGDS